MADLPTGTVTFLFTDIQGSTALWERDREAMQTALALHHCLLHAAIKANGGHVFNIVGDAFCAAFATAPKALAAALAAQRALRDADWGETPLRVRMGLHTGSAEAIDHDYRSGPTLNRVARVMGLAYGEQILLSQTTADLVRGETAGVTLRDMGLHRLKGFAEPERILQVITADLPSEFPPLAAPVTLPNNLPVQLTSFIGREREIAEVERLLTTTRLLTLTGSGGTGKTRLSLAVAADVLEQYSDGVCLVELAPLTDPAFVSQSVASALGVSEQPGQPIIMTLTDYLRDKQLLLILDNCEHLIAACAALADILLHAAPQLKILASSREALGIAGEATYHVPSLPSPNPITPILITDLPKYDGIRLFVERAVAAKSSFALSDANAKAVVQVCYRLDGIPLAIELAAARVRVFSAEQIAARLDDRFRLLTGGSRTALPRQQTLRATIDWSYSLLSEPERTFLRRLSVFAGGWTLEAAESVCAGDGLELIDVLDLLAHLVEKSLVAVDEEAGEVRYRMLETVRQYARDKLLEASEGDWVRTRHLAFFTRFAADANEKIMSAEQIRWLRRFEAEYDNLRAAIEWSRDDDPWARLQLPAVTLYFWMIHGNFSEGIEALRAALAGVPSTALTPRLGQARVQALLALSGLLVITNRTQEARQLASEALVLSESLSDNTGRGRAFVTLGMAAVNQGEFTAAHDWLVQGLSASRAVNDQPYIAFALRLQGDEAYLQGDYERARPLYLESATTYRSIGDNNYRAYPLRVLGYIALYRGELDGAAALMGESLSLNLAIKEKQGTIGCLAGLAAVCEARGQSVRAATLFGCVAALLEAMDTTLLLLDQRDCDRNLAMTRAHLDVAICDAAWAAGRAMTLDQAVVYALEEMGADNRRGRHSPILSIAHLPP